MMRVAFNKFDLTYAIKEGRRCYVYDIPSRELATRIMRIISRRPSFDKIVRYCPRCGSHDGCSHV
jgi:hypothetical protein